MREIGTLQPRDLTPIPADTVQTLLIASSSGQTIDLPSGANIGRFSGMTTAGAQMQFVLNIGTTKAAVPTSGQSTHGTTGFGYQVHGQGQFQIPAAASGGSSAWSVAAFSCGYVTGEFWKR